MKKTLAFMLSAALAACQVDSYDSGDGEYSLLTADFAEVHTAAPATVDYAVTDGGDSLVMEQPVSVEWAAKPDTLYRAVVYYDRSGGRAVRARGVVQVPVLRAGKASDFDRVLTDPLGFESAWVGADGKYLNIGLYIKVGEGGAAGARHVVGLVCDSVVASAGGVRTTYLRLYHDQGGVPEHYSSKTYVSVRCASLQADSAVVAVETYSGTVIRGLRLSEQ